MTYKTFAIAGGLDRGVLGSAVLGNSLVKSLITYPDAVSQSAKELESLGVTVAPVVHSNQESLITAIKDVQVVISTITITALAVQSSFVQAVAASKKQGNKVELRAERVWKRYDQRRREFSVVCEEEVAPPVGAIEDPLYVVHLWSFC
ncbi:hypothetical protein QFC21_006082 [Naganishia friedmannii]|uniref:Uncharacterized protein n=1 Tax=Naganishia friedmannii TaxID=89922 RepID=A0ACC2V6H9_9TREE|nr:hypothetical protein QFC21_006082 [Naganishia friedmannii]